MIKCHECDAYKVKTDKGFYCCPGCGICNFNYMSHFMVHEVYERDTTVYSKPSVHSRFKWITKLLDRKMVLHDDNQIDAIAYDSCDVVKIMNSKGLLKGRNVSRYDYFVIGLASRRGVSFDCTKLSDLVPGKIKRERDNMLFEIVYPSLEWEPDDCIYYKNWKEYRNGKK